MNPENFLIRRASPADNLLLAEFGSKAFADNFASANTLENMAAYLAEAFSPQKQAQELAEPNSVFLIAQAGEEMVGYTRLVVGPPPECISGARPIELMRVYAAQAWIGKGVGPALMRASLDEAAKRGCDTVWLGVWEHNPRALAFYHKWGFGDVGSHIFQLGDDPQTDIIMERSVPIT